MIVGLAAKPLIEGPLASLWVVAGSLIVGSGLMWAADQMGRHKRGEDDTTLKDAMLVGSSQILALLFPGFSRSGATMSTGLQSLDLNRVAAARLSFFLGIPALTGAGLYELEDAVIGAGGDITPPVRRHRGARSSSPRRVDRLAAEVRRRNTPPTPSSSTGSSSASCSSPCWEPAPSTPDCGAARTALQVPPLPLRFARSSMDRRTDR